MTRAGERTLAAAAGALGHAAIVALALAAASRWSPLELHAEVVVATLLGCVAVASEILSQHDCDDVELSPTDRALAVATALGVALATVGGVVERAVAGHTPFLQVVAALPFAALGIALRARAIRVLGRDFVTAARAPSTLVERDVYAWVRHPSETGLVLFTLGLALSTGSVSATLGAVASCGLAAWRARREDEALRRAFGPRFDGYAARVPSLVPRVLGPSRAAKTRALSTRATS